MAVCTYSDVFEFCGTDSSVQSTQQTAITNLISRCTADVEKTLGRKVESTTVSNVIFQDGLNCEILGNRLFLKGEYRDIYSISSIYECGLALTAVTDYNQSYDYFLDSKKGIIIRHLQPWNLEPFNIKISFSYGLGGASVLGDIKQAVIESVAAKSGLWKYYLDSEEGRIERTRTSPSAKTMDSLKKYILRDL